LIEGLKKELGDFDSEKQAVVDEREVPESPRSDGPKSERARYHRDRSSQTRRSPESAVKSAKTKETR
jgi:hypothetical protein